MRDTSAVEIAGWSTDHPAPTIAGSLYSVPPSHRMEAAEAVCHRGHRVHLDLIIEAKGDHRGVDLGCLTSISRGFPSALIDLHLIVEGDLIDPPVRAAVTQVLTMLQPRPVSQSVLRLIVSEAVFHSFSDLIKGLVGMDLWLDLPPAVTAENLLGYRGMVQGILIMLIEPGTSDLADTALLSKVPVLARYFDVGIDGGVTRDIAAVAADLGVTYLVSGRALLLTGSPSSADQQCEPSDMKEVSK